MPSKPQKQRSAIVTRIIRPGTPEPADTDWMDMSPEERIAAVWELTRMCLAWNRDDHGELRLQRSVSRVQRPKR